MHAITQLRHRLFAALAAAGTLSLSAAASGQDAGARTHDGFHLSLGAGAAYTTTAVSLDPEAANPADISVTGMGFAGHLLIGGTVAPGLVIGGGNMGFHVFSPQVSVDGTDSDTDSALAGNLLGVYADYYFDNHGGLHALALLGLATLDDGDDDTDKLAVGFGAALGVGYEWWVADEWSIGALGRVQFMSTTVEFETINADLKYETVAPALLLTATYH
jgi:hypothetical protein